MGITGKVPKRYPIAGLSSGFVILYTLSLLEQEHLHQQNVSYLFIRLDKL